MTNKAKSFFLSAVVAGLAFGGGFGLSKNNAKKEKELLKAKVERAFNACTQDNSAQLTKIGAEKVKLHKEAQSIISAMIQEQKGIASQQMDAFYAKAIKSLSKKEIEQLKEEWKNCSDFEPCWDSMSLVRWAINIQGNTNIATDFKSLSDYDICNASVKYTELAKKRRVLRREWEKICAGFVYDRGNEKDFIESVAVVAPTDTVKFYSHIMQDFADHYNSQHNEITYWENSYNASGYRTRTGHINIMGKNLVPKFSLIAFQKKQKALNEICARFQELDAQEQQLQNLLVLKQQLVADMSR